MNDADFLHHALTDGAWHSWHEIMNRSVRERGCGLTIHSRAAQLRRKRGLTIECRTERVSGRSVSHYRLVTLDAATPDGPPSPGGGLTANSPALQPEVAASSVAPVASSGCGAEQPEPDATLQLDIFEPATA